MTAIAIVLPEMEAVVADDAETTDERGDDKSPGKAMLFARSASSAFIRGIRDRRSRAAILAAARALTTVS